ncbi:LOW QUALITY PROTEIN: disks large-associated protein 5 [Trematomus bernacchii]|uniref:LOW QUALITY PROTEIN: disks large-associated protein 5 n=1 Tax=Trematomus bernacchii TaxID=40690 RepID=UPI00146DC888|nr:LOW QUALITY PROTEIN: disks large-associated protein 5 [Trematomus bernacchii]
MNMDSRFAHLRQRDASVSMLRVKMSRRRSQSQKENRERAMNTRRQLDQVPEMEMASLDDSTAMAMSVIQEKTLNNAKSAKNIAGEERLKQLQRWKERKTLEKEKEMREKERKGVFKTGLYHPKDGLSIDPLPKVPAGSTRSKESLNTTASQSVRVTRSMKQQQVQKPLKMQNLNTATKKAQPAVERSTRTRVAPVKPAPAPAATKIKVCAVEAVVRAASTRSANRPPVKAPVVKDKPKGKPADVRTTRSRAFVDHVAPPSDQEQNCKETDNTVEPAVFKVPEMQEPEEDMVVDQAPADSIPAEGPVDAPPSLSSFAPTDFIFKAPTGLPSFKFEPLTPRSADAFLTPRSPLLRFPDVPAFNVEPEAELSGPSPPKSPQRSPPHTSPTMAPPTPGSLLETKHDVSYFRSEMSKETDALSALCVVWEPKVEHESIPEEMRDSIRTVVGQARLLMKERFKQFGGLVDDCDLGRGEKITTCTTCRGFWDMVYYQVEDVYKKFEALKVAESRSWVEEHKPAPRQRKAVKKPSAAPAKPAGTKAAGAKSRLAAVKAAMKAKQQAAEAEKAAEDAGNDEENPSLDSQEPQPEAEPQPAAQVLSDGDYFQVESPPRPSGGSVRRSCRLSATPQPQASPSSNYPTPGRFTRLSLALSQTPVSTAASPSHTLQTPALLHLTLRESPAQTPKSQRGTPQASRNRNKNVSLCFSPAKEVRSDDTRPEKSPAHPAVSMQENTAAVPELSTPTPVRSLPAISVVMEQEEPSEAVDVDLPLSSRLSLSPCKTPLPVSHAPEPSPSLSLVLSPPTSPPPAVEAPESVCQTPDTSVVEEILGLDFERYLQPSLRCSPSPQATVAVETLAVDVEMESPGGPSEDLPSQREPAAPGVSSMLFLQSPQMQKAECDMLLFTPDMKERIRQSVCPSDLMVFTPPSNV